MAIVTTERLKLGAAHLRQIHSLIVSATLQPIISHLSIISRYTLSLPSQRLQGESNDVQVTIIPWSLLMTYPLDHTMVPTHRRASPDEVCRLLGCSNGGTSHHHRKATERKANLLPCLRTDDPIAQYLGLETGEIVRIDRLDGSVYYRVIVKAV
jgi:DNA-directed RNA polymerase subunit H (RpoH/RPB5)